MISRNSLRHIASFAALLVLLPACARLAGTVFSVNPPIVTTPIQQVLAQIKDQIVKYAPLKQYSLTSSTTLYGRTPGASCEAIRFLYLYYSNVNPDAVVLAKINSIAQFLLSIQVTDSTKLEYGGFPAQPDTGSPGVDPLGVHFFYSIEAAFCGRAMLEAYNLTGTSSYLASAVAAAAFLRKMQRPNDQAFPMHDLMVLTNTPGNGGVPTVLGGFSEYYRNDLAAMDGNEHTKLNLALPFLRELAQVTQDIQYVNMATEARSFLSYGLTNGYEWYMPISNWSGDNAWHRVTDGISEKYVYEDSIGYSIRSIFQYEGNSPALLSAYQVYNGLNSIYPNYQPSIAWTGYLWPSNNSSGSNYYDLTSIGILMGYRKFYDFNSYLASKNALMSYTSTLLSYWSTDFSFNPTITTMQDMDGIANIGAGIIESQAYLTDSVSSGVVNTGSPLAIGPPSQTILPGIAPHFTASGGVTPYTFSVVTPGGGTIDATGGTYSPPTTPGTYAIRVTDNAGTTATATVTLVVPKKVVAGLAHSCVLFSNGEVKCWGQNDYGQLGLGDIVNRGTSPGDMGSNLPAVQLGTGKTAIDIAAGGWHTCVILNDNSMKCWGRNDQGQLGQGDTSTRGNAPNQMGDNLPAISLGTGLTAKAISARYLQTCAILSNNGLKCWGFNTTGQLGRDNQNSVGWAAGQMGDSLSAINVGTGRTALQISAGRNHTCAILDDSSVKCWGYNAEGELGQGNTTNVGDGLGNTMASLSPVNLGGGATATGISVGDKHTCVILNNGSVKCWGYNASGQLGQGNTTQIGDGVGPSVSAASAIDLGGGGTLTASAISSADYHTCAILNTGVLKCWGYNVNGELGQGDTTSRGYVANQMGNSLLPVEVGWGYTVLSVAAGGGETTNSHVCAILSPERVKCFGLNASGQLGLGDNKKRGDTMTGLMGDMLPWVNLML